MGPNNNLSYLLTHLAAVLSKQTNQLLLEQLGVGFSQYRILMVLEWNPRLTQKAIANSLGQTEAGISRQVGLLKAKGLLETKIDPTDKRKHMNEPTALGMQVTEAASSLLRHGLESDIAGLNSDQLAKLMDSLQRLHKTVCRSGKLGACDHQLGLI